MLMWLILAVGELPPNERLGLMPCVVLVLHTGTLHSMFQAGKNELTSYKKHKYKAFFGIHVRLLAVSKCCMACL